MIYIHNECVSRSFGGAPHSGSNQHSGKFEKLLALARHVIETVTHPPAVVYNRSAIVTRAANTSLGTV